MERVNESKPDIPSAMLGLALGFAGAALVLTSGSQKPAVGNEHKLDTPVSRGDTQPGKWASHFEHALKAVAWVVVAATVLAKGNASQDNFVRATGALMAVAVGCWITCLFVAELRAIEARLIGRAAKRDWKGAALIRAAKRDWKGAALIIVAFALLFLLWAAIAVVMNFGPHYVAALTKCGG
jgi:hypothetical protein